MKIEKFNNPIYVRCLPSEKKLIIKKAKSLGQNTSAYARDVLVRDSGGSTPTHCVCGAHWGHTGKHRTFISIAKEINADPTTVRNAIIRKTWTHI